MRKPTGLKELFVPAALQSLGLRPDLHIK